MASESGREFAVKFQQTFELYLIGLVFTVLGLAVQTAPTPLVAWISLVEIAGWFFLGLSGVLGLLRLERVPIAHKVNAQVHEARESIAQVQEREARGDLTVPVVGQSERMPVAEALATLRDREEDLVKARARLEYLIPRMYSFHKWTFVIGLALIVIARAAWRLTPPAGAISL